MSYRNPTQVVDTQTGQHYANLQKTIAGSFGNYVNSVKAADAKEQQEKEKRAAQETVRLNGLIKERNKNVSSAMRTDLKYPTVDYGTGAKGIINEAYEIESKNPTRSIDQNQIIATANTVGDAARPAAEEYVGKQTTFNTAYALPIGTMGGISKGQELKVYEGLYNSTPDGIMSKTTALYTRDGSNNIVITYENGGKVFDPSNDSMLPQFVPDWQPSVDSFKKQGLTNELFNFADSNNEIYKGGEKIYENGRAVGVLPNRKKFEDSIKKGVRANVISGLSSNDAIALYNNVLRTPDKDGNMPDEIPQTKEWFIFDKDDKSPEALNQEGYQDAITNAATKFVANQAEYLKKPYKYTGKQGESAEDSFNDINSGKDFYNEVKKNPIGMYQEYVGVKPIFNREKNTITIGKESVSDYDKDNPELTKDVVYKMNDSTDRNRFYLNLLRASERTKGTSILSKKEQKGYEDALRNDTSFRSSKLDKKKKEAEAKAKEKADAKAKAEAEALEKEKNEAEVFKVDQKRGNQVTKRS